MVSVGRFLVFLSFLIYRMDLRKAIPQGEYVPGFTEILTLTCFLNSSTEYLVRFLFPFPCGIKMIVAKRKEQYVWDKMES